MHVPLLAGPPRRPGRLAVKKRGWAREEDAIESDGIFPHAGRTDKPGLVVIPPMTGCGAAAKQREAPERAAIARQLTAARCVPCVELLVSPLGRRGERNGPLVHCHRPSNLSALSVMPAALCPRPAQPQNLDRGHRLRSIARCCPADDAAVASPASPPTASSSPRVVWLRPELRRGRLV